MIGNKITKVVIYFFHKVKMCSVWDLESEPSLKLTLFFQLNYWYGIPLNTTHLKKHVIMTFDLLPEIARHNKLMFDSLLLFRRELCPPHMIRTALLVERGNLSKDSLFKSIPGNIFTYSEKLHLLQLISRSYFSIFYYFTIF